MRALLAFDKFKDALAAPQACAITADTLRSLHPDWQLDLCPLADGGEGFCAILTEAAHGTLETFTVTGPRGTPVVAPIGFVAPEKIPNVARARTLGKLTHIFAGAVTAAPLAGLNLHAITPPHLSLPTALRETPNRLAAAIAHAFPADHATPSGSTDSTQTPR